MGKESNIEWTDATWNPVRGCTKISPGCKNCYAETFAERWRGIPGHPFEQGFDLKLVPHKLNEPKKWKEPKKIFVNSMSDLFHKDIPFEYIQQVFEVMRETPHHIYQVLTKRPEIMRQFCQEFYPEPLQNVWLGTSVENSTYVLRADCLKNIPAAVRFLSIEPLLGEIDFIDLKGIDWVIVGGESGPKARPMHPDWVRKIRDLCVESDTAFFFKQWGEWVCANQDSEAEIDPFQTTKQNFGLVEVYRVGKKKAGRLLDGREWNEMPKVKETLSK